MIPAGDDLHGIRLVKKNHEHMMDGKNHILYDVIILKRLDYKSHASGGVDGKMPVMHARIRMGGKTANDLIYLFRILRKHVFL